MLQFVSDAFQKLPLPVLQKLKIRRWYRILAGYAGRYRGKRRKSGVTFQPLLGSNRRYGNEYALRTYAGIDEELYAIIEHGLFFGNNMQKIPPKHDYDLGCILTYGMYRKQLINCVFPDYYCETVGPPILYAVSEKQYREEVSAQLRLTGKTLLFFPAHGVEVAKPEFNLDEISECILSLAQQNGCRNVVISNYQLTPSDSLYRKLRSKTNKIRVVIYSCGDPFDQEFIFREKALISMSDVTASNSLGTHVGNCVGLTKPHVLFRQTITYEGSDVEQEFGLQTRSANWKDQFALEQKLFEKTFPFPSGQATLTEEQYKMCDYYWGFTQKKTPEEIRDIYHKCRAYALRFTERIDMKVMRGGVSLSKTLYVAPYAVGGAA